MYEPWHGGDAEAWTPGQPEAVLPSTPLRFPDVTPDGVEAWVICRSFGAAVVLPEVVLLVTPILAPFADAKTPDASALLVRIAEAPIRRFWQARLSTA